MAFNLATVIARSSENKIHGALAYVMAFLTAWSRVHDQKHWASDVILGGALSVAISTAVIDTYEKRKP
jgi:membrane-associated phospholipid phosphatase